MSNEERMAPVDTTWLRMDRPTNLMVIVGVLVLEGPVDPIRLENALAKRLLGFPRFRQRTETRQTGTWWCDDPQFDIARHIKRVRLPGAADKAELERLVAELAATPLDPLHPLWQFHIVEDYNGGAAIVARIHHAIADGIALIGVLLSLTDEYVGAAAHRTRRIADKHKEGSWLDLIAPVMEVVGEGLRVSANVLRGS